MKKIKKELKASLDYNLSFDDIKNNIDYSKYVKDVKKRIVLPLIFNVCSFVLAIACFLTALIVPNCFKRDGGFCGGYYYFNPEYLELMDNPFLGSLKVDNDIDFISETIETDLSLHNFNDISNTSISYKLENKLNESVTKKVKIPFYNYLKGDILFSSEENYNYEILFMTSNEFDNIKVYKNTFTNCSNISLNCSKLYSKIAYDCDAYETKDYKLNFNDDNFIIYSFENNINFDERIEPSIYNIETVELTFDEYIDGLTGTSNYEKSYEKYKTELFLNSLGDMYTNIYNINSNSYLNYHYYDYVVELEIDFLPNEEKSVNVNCYSCLNYCDMYENLYSFFFKFEEYGQESKAIINYVKPECKVYYDAMYESSTLYEEKENSVELTFSRNYYNYICIIDGDELRSCCGDVSFSSLIYNISVIAYILFVIFAITFIGLTIKIILIIINNRKINNVKKDLNHMMK